MALAPITNQLRPPRARDKVYGRKRHIPVELRDANCSLFGGDDRIGIENRLAAIELREKPLASAETQSLPLATTINNSREQPRQNGLRESTSTTEAVQNDSRAHNDKKTINGERSALQNAKPTKTRLRKVSQAELDALKPILRQPRISSSLRSFEGYGARLTRKFDVSKLSEGSYSDCFIIRKPGRNTEAAVLKIVPFDCGGQKSARSVTDAHDFLREVQLLTALERYHGFAQIFEGQVVRGRLHDKLLRAARAWLDVATEDVDKSIDPAIRYPDDQMTGVIEMAFAGQDLELLKQPSAFQAFDAFWMAVVLISKAETDIQFEHRDLHMSNICFRPGEGGNIDVSHEYIKSMKRAPVEILGLSGLQITIIDYTHSRMKDPKTGEILFNPESPFTAEDLAFFRQNCHPCDQMDTAVKSETWMSKCFDQQSENGPKYRAFTPKTNVIWLSHVLQQLTMHVKHTKQQAMLADSSPMARKVQVCLWKKLAEVLKWIGSSDLDTLPDSAARFLEEAIDKNHVSRKEVDSFMKRLNVDS